MLTHTHRNTHFPFVKNANKANDWLIISPTCIHHYHVWSSLSISPQHSHFILHFSLFHHCFYQYFIPANYMKQRGLFQIPIINIWLLQGAVQRLKKWIVCNNPRESYTGNHFLTCVTRVKATKKLKNCRLPQTNKSEVQPQWLVKGSKKEGKPLLRPVRELGRM